MLIIAVNKSILERALTGTQQTSTNNTAAVKLQLKNNIQEFPNVIIQIQNQNNYK